MSGPMNTAIWKIEQEAYKLWERIGAAKRNPPTPDEFKDGWEWEEVSKRLHSMVADFDTIWKKAEAALLWADDSPEAT